MKALLRKKYIEQRSKLSQEKVDELSLAIANQALTIDCWEKTYYHLFLPIIDKNEINTEYLLQILHGKDKEVVLSKSNFDTLEMQHILLTDNTKIKTNQYGIPEPTNGLTVPDSHIDVVFIPLLGFDSKGNRIGYGKGFYDRFLANCKAEVIKIGLSYFAADDTLFETLPTDIPLNHCITPTAVYSF